MPPQDTAKPIRIGTGERGGTFYTQGLALKAAIERIPHAPDIEVLESSAGVSIENANRLEAGEIDFGFISAPWVVAAKQGTAPFMRAIDIRVAAPMNLGPNFFIARANSGLRKVADLRGRRVAVGMKDGGMAPHAEGVSPHSASVRAIWTGSMSILPRAPRCWPRERWMRNSNARSPTA